ncbi:NADH-quinone oxidoreductase subunit C [Spirosoma utsteinense]|uniref:NADH-quinone oxidoreductase subunit C n=1 Tax=Spirosoma utsteinense TaxID=2585773 RepID=A0ABR6W2Z6_9BACT|nr:NADH-quinone oxidoreductase subunit C [Spirosoma utsteinense]MBC3784248.1 NADH-quinone oxidoreductase subunit C [Spirosoma utsteinense]MBC3790955.1 NADH-quinone oxidoreductase subunit C [Spirosoma utsteinense]
MTFSELTDLLATQFGADVLVANTTNPQPYLTIPADRLVEICQFLRDDERVFFDLLACVTAIDNGVDAGTMEVVYNLTSIPYEHNLMLKLLVPRGPGGSRLPAVPSVAHIWRTADWHEREAFDLMGINFTGHPDLRRILLPTDWKGHPLRRDYQEDEQYHGIKTK